MRFFTFNSLNHWQQHLPPDVTNIQPLVTAVFQQQTLPERVDALITLHHRLTEAPSTAETMMALRTKTRDFLAYLLNASQDDELAARIQDRETYRVYDPGFITMPSAVLPGARALRRAHALVQANQTTLSPATVYARCLTAFSIKALQCTELKAERAPNQFYDNRYPTRRLSPSEQEACRVLPCNQHHCAIQLTQQLNDHGETELVIDNFSSAQYNDIRDANGYAMFVMRADGSLWVGSRRYFPRAAGDAEAFFHSSLSNGYPVVCPGLLRTQENTQGIAHFALVNNAAGHFRGGLLNLRLFLRQALWSGMVSKEQLPRLFVGQNSRGWPEGEMTAEQRLNRQTVLVDPQKILHLATMPATTEECRALLDTGKIDLNRGLSSDITEAELANWLSEFNREQKTGFPPTSRQTAFLTHTQLCFLFHGEESKQRSRQHNPKITTTLFPSWQPNARKAYLPQGAKLDWRFQPTVLVTGANRGIGLAFVRYYVDRGYRVIATCRDPETATDLHAVKQQPGSNVQIYSLNVHNTQDAKTLAFLLQKRGQSIDILINNAGVKGGPPELQGQGFQQHTPESMREAFDVNCVGPFNMAKHFLPLVSRSLFKAIVYISSGYASISDNGGSGGAFSYRTSKAAGNMAIRTIGQECKQTPEHKDIVAFSVTAGWVRTDMGGANARLSPNESVANMAQVIDHVIKTRDGSTLYTHDSCSATSTAASRKGIGW